MKKTLLQIKEADQLVVELYKKNPALENSKFGYSWKRFMEKNYVPEMKKFNEKVEDLRLEHALTDEKTKELLLNEKGNYKFSVEGMKALTAKYREMSNQFDAIEVDIEPRIVSQENLPELSEEEKEILTGLII